MDEQTLFLQALEKDTPEIRAQWLDDVCGRATPLRQRIEALLGKHEQANSFLERPIFGSSAQGSTKDAVTEAFKPELARTARNDGPVVIGNHSVLKSLGSIASELPHVVLREPVEEGVDPVVKPASPEIPDRHADSRYQLQGEIAQGGMGAIIKGRDVDLGRDLAIKVLLEAHKDKLEIVQRFVEEAQIGGQLQHPGIAPVYELGQFSDRRPFFSMKLVKGKTLSALFAARSNPSQDRAKFLRIFEQICQTMAYAHSRGVIHRDLKPANIMVGAFGEVQVMDWGLAKVLSTGGLADERNEQKTSHEQSIIQTLRSLGSETPAGFGSQTQLGSVMGTPAYMSPEQALGEIDRLDERSDVFSLGAILCIILTGEPPYVGEDGTQVFRQAVRGKLEDCFRRLDACGADKDVVDLAKHCIEVEPSDRPRDAGVLAERVSRYLESVENRLRETELERAAETARAEEERKRFRVTLALATSVLLLIGVAGGGWTWIKHQQSERLRVATNNVTEALNEARLNEGLAAAGELDEQLQKLELAVNSAEHARDLSLEEDIEATLRQRAEQLLTGLNVREAAIRKRAKQAKADRNFQQKLEEIRLRQADQGERPGPTEGLFFDAASADDRYEEAFREAGMDVLALDTSEAAEQIRASAIRESIIAGLDNWVRTLTAAPKTTEEQFHRLTKARDYAAAAQIGQRLVKQSPQDTDHWLRLAPVLVLTGDETAYRDFCRRMTKQFAGTDNVQAAERTCKACLLLPGAIDLAQLPQRKLAELLDEGHLPNWFLPWGHFARALFAYRSGDADSALDYVQKAAEHNPSEFAKASNLAVCALAEQQLGHADRSRKNLDEASAVVAGLLEEKYDPVNHHDLLIAQILLREAAVLLAGDGNPTLLAENERDSTNLAASSTKPLPRRGRLLAVADQADANEWREQLRAGLKDHDIVALKELAASGKTQAQSPELIAWLGAVLRDEGQLETSVNVLKEAQQNHSGDFWLNIELSTSLRHSREAAEAVEFARAALAIRPDNLGALHSLALALGDAGRNEDFYHVQHQILLRTLNGGANLGALWDAAHTPYALNHLDHTIDLARGYTEAYPNDALGHLLLAALLSNAGDRVEESLAPFRRFLELKPNEASNYAWFATYLGNNCIVNRKFSAAIEAYRLGVELAPEDSLMWLRLAPALVLAGEEAGYREYCQDVVNHFAGTNIPDGVERTCRACLLLPGAIDLKMLPQETLSKSLDDDTAPQALRPWGWGTRALLAYRGGNADVAIQYVQESELRLPDPLAHAQNLTILALAHQELGQLDEARDDVAHAAKAIDTLHVNNTTYHAQLISQILLHEAESQINAKDGQTGQAE